MTCASAYVGAAMFTNTKHHFPAVRQRLGDLHEPTRYATIYRTEFAHKTQQLKGSVAMTARTS